MNKIWTFAAMLFTIFGFNSANAQLLPIVPPGGFLLKEIPTQDIGQKLYGQMPLKPGIYQLENLNSKLCAGYFYAGLFQPQKARLGFCNANSKDADRMVFAITPTIDNKYIIRPAWKALPHLLHENCLTVARGVLIGAKDIDSLVCDYPIGGSGRNTLGVDDQKFQLVPTGNDYFEIRTNDNECFAVRDASRNPEAGIIKWPCSGGADQKWRANFIQNIVNSEEIKALNDNYWYLVGNQYLMAKPVGGWFFQGKQIRKFANPNDNGKKCGMHCLDDASCKAFTWRPASIDNSCNGESCCTLFSGVTSTQTPNDGSYSGVVQR